MQDTILLAKLSGGDMMSQDALYHTRCLVLFYRKVDQLNDSQCTSETNTQSHGIALSELLEYIEDRRLESETKPVFKLTDLAQLYKQRINQLGVDKERILANLPNIEILNYVS